MSQACASSAHGSWNGIVPASAAVYANSARASIRPNEGSRRGASNTLVAKDRHLQRTDPPGATGAPASVSVPGIPIDDRCQREGATVLAVTFQQGARINSPQSCRCGDLGWQTAILGFSRWRVRTVRLVFTWFPANSDTYNEVAVGGTRVRRLATWVTRMSRGKLRYRRSERSFSTFC